MTSLLWVCGGLAASEVLGVGAASVASGVGAVREGPTCFATCFVIGVDTTRASVACVASGVMGAAAFAPGVETITDGGTCCCV